MADSVKIQTIQFKRGTKANLESYLVGDNKPKAGEPIFEYDKNDPTVGKLKIGNGVSSYADLPYVTGSGGASALVDLTDVIIQNPLDGQVLYFNGTNWVNRDIQTDLNNAVAAAQSARDAAETYKTQAGNAAANAGTSANAAAQDAQKAEYAVTEIKDFINGKFWWGTLSEYNALPHIDENVFYFITAEE